MNASGALLLGGAAVLLLALGARPLVHGREDDRGDGLGQVVLPAPRSVSFARVLGFYLCSSALTLVLVAIRPGPVTWYQEGVARLALVANGDAAATLAYAHHVSAPLRLVVVANVGALVVVLRAPVLRRAVVLAHAALFLVVVLLLDGLGTALSSAAHLPLQSASLLGSLVILAVALLVVLRILSTTFVVPRPSAVRPCTPARRGGTALLVLALGVAVVVVLGLVDVTDTAIAIHHPTAFLLAFTGFALIFEALLAFLLLAAPRLRSVSDAPALAITTITPAFNEEATIERTLLAIDAAAGRYGGAVTVVLADDGSIDRTAAVAEAVMTRFVHAEGRLVRARHGGKSAALNKALAIAQTAIVVRIDADVVVAEDAFCRLPGWFANADVGMVGALALPDPLARSWYAVGRLFECLVGFAFARVALQRVDAINCIPGTFMAFRRDPALSAGGFVSGMNGEDSDLTMLFGRMAYRVVVDTRIRIFEDVPRSLRAFREQRVRWNRAGVHIMARHSPLLAGAGSARTWFFYLRAASVRITAALRPLVFLAGLEISLVNPATRAVSARVLLFYLVAAVPTLAAISVLALRHGFARRLVLLPLWFPFTLLRRIVALEGLLTLPTRGVSLRLGTLVPTGARGERVRSAAVRSAPAR